MKQKTDIKREKVYNIQHSQESNISKEQKESRRSSRMETELLIEGGDEMIKSLEILHNRVGQKKIIPKQ